MQTDLAWFKANPSATLRVRDPLPGEIDELAALLLPAGTKWNGCFAIPEGQRAQVVAMRVSRRLAPRFLAAAPCDDAGNLSGSLPGFSLVPIALGARVALA